MNTKTEQALRDAEEVLEWMLDNNEGNTHVDFAMAYGQISSVIAYLKERKKGVEFVWENTPFLIKDNDNFSGEETV